MRVHLAFWAVLPISHASFNVSSAFRVTQQILFDSKSSQKAATRKSCWNILSLNLRLKFRLNVQDTNSTPVGKVFDCILSSFKPLVLFWSTLKLQTILKSSLNSQINADYEKNMHLEVFQVTTIIFKLVWLSLSKSEKTSNLLKLVSIVEI